MWLVRIFFILIDCLPIFVKFFGGKSAYDQIIADTAFARTTLHRDGIKRIQQDSAASLEILRVRNEAEIREERSLHDLRHRENLAQRQIKLNAATEALAASILNETRSRRAQRPMGNEATNGGMS
jgi:hypothetical protein